MAGDSKKVQPIIIKRIKKGGHAAHGGAWKIAYYFNSPLKIAMFGGSGAGDATSVVKGGGNNLAESTGQIKKGMSETADEKRRKNAMKMEQARAEAERLKALKQKVEEVIANDERLSKYKSQIQLDMTAEGLRIQIVDDQQRPMFASGDAQVQGYMRDILRAIGGVLDEVPNRLTIEGHTDAKPFSAGDRSGSKVWRVQGLAASMLFEKGNPESPLNRRISVIVMNREAEDRFFQAAKIEAIDATDDEALTGKEEPAPDINPSSPGRPGR